MTEFLTDWRGWLQSFAATGMIMAAMHMAREYGYLAGSLIAIVYGLGEYAAGYLAAIKRMRGDNGND